MRKIRAGDRVSWSSYGGVAHGKMLKTLRAPAQIKGHKVAASKA